MLRIRPLLALAAAALALACATPPSATVVYLGISEGRPDAALIQETVAAVAQAWQLAPVTLNPGYLAERAWARGPSRFRGDLYVLADVLPPSESVFIELALEPASDADATSFEELCGELERDLQAKFGERLVSERSRRPFPAEGRALQRW